MERPYTPGLLTWLFRVLPALWFLGVAVYAAGGGDLGEVLTAVVLYTPMLLFAWWVSRLGVWVDGERVVVRRLLGVDRYRWADVVGFDDVEANHRDVGPLAHLSDIILNSKHNRYLRLRLTGAREVVVSGISTRSMRFGDSPVVVSGKLAAKRPTAD